MAASGNDHVAEPFHSILNTMSGHASNSADAPIAHGDGTMKMSELILAVGDEHVRFQNLLNDAQSIDKTKHGTKITFYTDGVQVEELLCGDSGKTKNIGLVVWLPRDRVDAAVAAEKPLVPSK